MARQPLLQAGVDGHFRKGYEAALVTLAPAFELEVRAIGLEPHLGVVVRDLGGADQLRAGTDRVTATMWDRDVAPRVTESR